MSCFPNTTNKFNVQSTGGRSSNRVVLGSTLALCVVFEDEAFHIGMLFPADVQLKNEKYSLDRLNGLGLTVVVRRRAAARVRSTSMQYGAVRDVLFALVWINVRHANSPWLRELAASFALNQF